jgi:hypothetical protein
MPELLQQTSADACHPRTAADTPGASSCHQLAGLWTVAPGVADLDSTPFNQPDIALNGGFGPCEMATAVVQVGSCDGRGFIVGNAHGPRYVVTAAHCLERSRFPRPNLAFQVREWTFSNVMAQLGANRGTISAELCVINLADDIAVFGEPNRQEHGYEAHQYERFTAAAMPVAEPPPVQACRWRNASGSKGWVLGLDGTWLSCSVHNSGRLLRLDGAEIKAGMFGSPIVNDHGAAVGLISAGERGAGYNDGHCSLVDCLPAWLWRKLQCCD